VISGTIKLDRTERGCRKNLRAASFDNTQFGSVDVAIKKAISAAAYRRPTKDFSDVLAQGGLGNRMLILPYAMPVEGGLPIIIDGKVVGAIGASGGTAQQDGIAATAGVNALK
jgi:glc operon protein GlcG